jgi:hypothetical protein
VKNSATIFVPTQTWLHPRQALPCRAGKPNPYAWDINPRLPRHKHGFTLAKRLPTNNDLDYISPGHYNDNYRNKPPAYTIATRLLAKHEAIYPGAKEYSPVFVRGPSGFTFAGHNDAPIDHGYPSPGAYSPASPAARQRISVGAPPVLQWDTPLCALAPKVPFPWRAYQKTTGSRSPCGKRTFSQLEWHPHILSSVNSMDESYGA